ncbi:MAG TPA: YitT family protein [Thermotogota bacterium]|nr:YitT family protein [Thermotogota bacterium]HRW92238.1 YitT family protein [Thermotogota bacterium]
MQARKGVFKEFFFSTLGTFLVAIGLVSFLIPHNIACGGASGMAIVLARFVPLPVGVLMYLVNGVLFALSFWLIGKEFGFRSLYCTFVLTFFVDLLDRLVPFPKYTGEDLFLSMSFGVMISAVGMAITFSQDSSTGGTDILARIFNRYLGLAMGTSLLLIDLVVALAAGIAFDARVGMYSIISVIFNGLTIDYVLKMIDNHVTLTIISTKEDQIASYIMQKLDRGVSFLKGEGGFSGEEKYFLYVAVRRREMGELFRHIRKIDPSAFIVAQEVSHVIGNGFKKINKVF